ncbi:LytR/AlgR family response regulator transcription factor [Flavihumibacter petaseus]|uniref:Putative two-component response regulator n=1 Tax=Flavihumibacter petaseus NBRC 106054 TaxID=1220578 RepID=A0A0E9N767_9BACT|nr:LytTR family DNA-binding domain-containing protein [Flavihumibacter petaseus]GAO45541.1 putative two-component response regulator [Flavihumibacter petaseus NBRC 106054]
MTALIIEDEFLLAKELKYKINKIDPGIEILEMLSSLKAARKWLMQHAAPDFLFMDVHLGDGMSFELFDTFQLTCPVIFTTAYDEYAIRAFKSNGIDYLLKPVDEEELKAAIQKTKNFLQPVMNSNRDWHKLLASMTGAQPGKVYRERILADVRNYWVPINVSDAACFIRENLNYVFTLAGDKYPLDVDSLDELEEMLNPAIFFRANRQCIININAIHRIIPSENQKLNIQLKAPLKLEVDISREKAPAFRKWIDR